MKTGLRALAVAATVTATAGGVVFGGPGSVSRAAAAGFEGGAATARAEAVRVQIDSVGAPGTDRPVDFAFPSSSAGVSALQGSSAQASLAYPGEIVLNGPGLCQVVLPQCKAPDYPFIVETNYGTRNEAQATYGLTTLQAASEQWMSKGSAVSAQGDPATAGGQNASLSTGTIDPETGVARAEAATVTDAISFGDTLKIASVHATASVTQEPGQDVVRSSTLAVHGLTITGQAVGITEQGLVVGTDPTPLPAGNPFEQALAQAGIKLRWLGGYDTTDGVVAPSLEIVAQGQMPGLPAPSILTIRLGYATATVQAGRATAGSFDISFGAGNPTTGVSPELPAAEPTGDIVSDAQATPDPDSASTPDAVGEGSFTLPDLTIGGQPLDLAVGAGPALEAAPPAAAGITPAAPRPQLRNGAPDQMAIQRAAAVVGSSPSGSGRTLYVLLAGGALVALLAVPVFRLLAMRLGGHS
ncbi:MAG TPA: hypothetical protein VFS16_20635 [Acidimicrobiia bacterium]|nr:hypothetical protein [Acidimicrobiia bacterium]